MAGKRENEDGVSISENENTVVRRITNNFSLDSPHQPCGDQPLAISSLLRGLEQGRPHQVLLGITGSGKTFTIANVIAGANRPTLVLAPNKTLAAQLYSEFRRLFPQNAVEYFVSYYDYYQPEAYVPSSDTYIAKDSSINEQIDRLRHSATRSLLERNDVIIVASVSCIYGLGSADAYEGMVLQVEVGQKMPRKAMLRKLVDIHYERNPTSFHRGVFRVRGDVVDIFPAHEEDRGVRIEMFGDEIERICIFDPLRGTVLEERTKMAVFPASHYVTPKEKMERAIEAIREELKHHLKTLDGEGKLLESQRLAQRTQFDLEMMGELGRCKGIENYSRHLSGRNAGEPPPTLIEYFPKNWLCVVDESHIAVPQLGAMYRGDRSRKQTLVEHGFRLPSALDNRPLQFEEFQEHVGQAIYVSATPGEWELGISGEECVEQIIRPTGLLDPEIEVRPAAHQVDDCLGLIRERVSQNERVLVTVLTKRMAQQLADYFHEVGVKAQYLHSDVKTLERLEILRNLRLGEFDVLVGINLLREGLDLPEVSLVCIMDADKEGFLRNERSLIQTIGRASRNIHGKVILYGDRLTKSMARAVEETRRRREIQERYNQKHGITPETIVRAVDDSIIAMSDADYVAVPPIHKQGLRPKGWSRDEQLVVDQVPSRVANLRKEMRSAAEKLAFEEAATLRDRIHELEQWALEMGEIH